ncbi:hypothetical protein BJ684DRAFT_21027 [Piptocephalis cylindrospora]|uniref:Uncharacterized protein n=1 Tax=Piptocephalis cylindrospora TaxID=1907219 RepID=A0A4P9Y0V0_9FUNG|nr:hypothetical protein BJ684DRAFT_21027 [Piptocephalis cylindrospora]|eukprot:RKP12436.1 hypothetical protein BJ684DRAFT_21027 [Piptocephalis cylindrospora]
MLLSRTSSPARPSSSVNTFNASSAGLEYAKRPRSLPGAGGRATITPVLQKPGGVFDLANQVLLGPASKNGDAPAPTSVDALVSVTSYSKATGESCIWDAFILNDCLYLSPPSYQAWAEHEFSSCVVALLELAEEVLECSEVTIVLGRHRADLDSLARAFMYTGFQVVSPVCLGHNSTQYLLLGSKLGESGLQWFGRLRAKHAYYGTTHLPGLDELIRHCRPAQPELRPGDCLSLYGRGGVGKTALLYYFALTTTLPPTWSPGRGKETVHLGGRGLPVVWIDLEGSFQVHRMTSLIRHHYDRCTSLAPHSTHPSSQDPPPSVNLNDLLQLTLDRLLVFRPTSPHQLLTLLSTTLPSILLTLPKPPALLFLDPINIYDSIDAALSAASDGARDPMGLGKKASSSSSSSATIRRAASSSSPISPIHRSLAQAYRLLVRQWSPLLIHTLRWPFPEWEEYPQTGASSSFMGDSRSWKECMPSWLQGIDTIRLWLSPHPPPALPSPSPTLDHPLHPPRLIQVRGKGSTRRDCPKMTFEIAEDGLFDLTSTLLL